MPPQTVADKAALAELVEAVQGLVRGIDSLRSHFATVKHVGITEMRALARIAGGDGVKPSELAESLDLTTGAVTALLDRLVKAGYAERQANPDDRRSLFVFITPEGRRLIDGLLQSFDAAIAAAAEGTEPEHVAAAAKVVAETGASLRRAFAEE